MVKNLKFQGKQQKNQALESLWIAPLHSVLTMKIQKLIHSNSMLL